MSPARAGKGDQKVRNYITLHWSYLKWSKCKTAKPLLYTIGKAGDLGLSGYSVYPAGVKVQCQIALLTGGTSDPLCVCW